LTDDVLFQRFDDTFCLNGFVARFVFLLTLKTVTVVKVIKHNEELEHLQLIVYHPA